MRVHTIAAALAIVLVSLTAPASAQLSRAADAPDPLLAALTPAPEVLATQTGRDALLRALASAEARSDLDEAAYAAGMALGARALELGDFQSAHRAWAAAVSHSGATSTPRAVLRRGRAQTGDAVTTIFQSGNHDSASARDQAYAALQQVATDLYPYALQSGDSAQLTPFQAAYAEAIGWRDLGRAHYTPRPIAPMHDVTGAIVCPTTWHGNNDVLNALALAHRGTANMAVFRILIDENGAATSVDVAYGGSAQDDAREIAILSRLRAERASNAPANCVMPHVLFQSLVFAQGAF